MSNVEKETFYRITLSERQCKILYRMIGATSPNYRASFLTTAEHGPEYEAALADAHVFRDIYSTIGKEIL